MKTIALYFILGMISLSSCTMDEIYTPSDEEILPPVVHSPEWNVLDLTGLDPGEEITFTLEGFQGDVGMRSLYFSDNGQSVDPVRILLDGETPINNPILLEGDNISEFSYPLILRTHLAPGEKHLYKIRITDFIGASDEIEFTLETK